MPLDHVPLAIDVPLADGVSACAVNGELAGNVVPATALAVCANESWLTNRICVPTGTLSCAGAYPADVPGASDVAANAVRLTSIVVTPATEADIAPGAPSVHAESPTTLAPSMPAASEMCREFMLRRYGARMKNL